MSEGEESVRSSDFEDSTEMSTDETDYFDSLTPQIRPESILLPEYSSYLEETSEDDTDPDIPRPEEDILWRPVRRPSPFSEFSFPSTEIMEIINARLADLESEEEQDGDDEEEDDDEDNSLKTRRRNLKLRKIV